MGSPPAGDDQCLVHRIAQPAAPFFTVEPTMLENLIAAIRSSKMSDAEQPQRLEPEWYEDGPDEERAALWLLLDHYRELTRLPSAFDGDFDRMAAMQAAWSAVSRAYPRD
jgi:hypothetical protein